MTVFILCAVMIALARPVIILKNKTTIELDIHRDYRPYIAEEFTVSRSGFTLNDPSGQHRINAYKTTLGIKYSDTDFIKIDPHWYIGYRRANNWQIDHGPALRIDVTF